MPIKEFLPRSIPLVELKDRLIENGPLVVEMPRKAHTCIKRVFPVLGLFSLLFGSAFLGFSIVTVEEGHVGYYSTLARDCTSVNGTQHCVVKSYPAGIYFEMPWKKGDFKTADVSPRSLPLGKIHYGDGKITTYPCIADYKVVDLNIYLHALIAFKSEQALSIALVDEVKRYISESLRDQQYPFNITYTTYGLLFGRVSFIEE